MFEKVEVEEFYRDEAFHRGFDAAHAKSEDFDELDKDFGCFDGKPSVSSMGLMSRRTS